jgi:hypothetical protein
LPVTCEGVYNRGSDDTERRVDVTLSASEPQERVSGSGACWTRTSPDVRKAARRYQAMSSSYDTIATSNQPTGSAASAIGRQSSPIFGFLRTPKKWPRQNFKGSGVSSDSSQSAEDTEEVGEVLLDEGKWLSSSVLVAGCSPTNWEGAIFFTRPASVDSESRLSAAELQDATHNSWNGYTSEQLHRVSLTRCSCSVRGEGGGQEDGGGFGSAGDSNSRKLNMWREAAREREHQRSLQRERFADKTQLLDETRESGVAGVSHAVSDPQSQLSSHSTTITTAAQLPSHITSVAAASSASVPKLSVPKHAVMSGRASRGVTTCKTTKPLARIKTFKPAVSQRSTVATRSCPLSPSLRPPTHNAHTMTHTHTYACLVPCIL